MKGLLLAILTVLVQPCFGGDHLITENRPAAENSPLEFTNIVRGARTAFVLAYLPSEKRGKLSHISFWLKEKKRSSESPSVWVKSPNVRDIGVFRMTWKDKDDAISKIFTFSADEVSRMVAVVFYWNGEEQDIYFYPMADVFGEKPRAKIDLRYDAS